MDDRIGRVTGMLVNMLDPDIIVLENRVADLDRLCVNVPRKWPSDRSTGKSAARLVLISRGPDAIVARACIHATMAG